MAQARLQRLFAVMRILTGLLFVLDALPKLGAAYLLGFKKEILIFSEGNPYPWFSGFLKGAVTDHHQVFALGWSLAELVIGFALILGLFTGIACLAGFLWTGVFLLATSHLKGVGDDFAFAPSLYAWPGLHLLMLLVLLFFSKSGRVWGVDAVLRPRKGYF